MPTMKRSAEESNRAGLFDGSFAKCWVRSMLRSKTQVAASRAACGLLALAYFGLAAATPMGSVPATPPQSARQDSTVKRQKSESEATFKAEMMKLIARLRPAGAEREWHADMHSMGEDWATIEMRDLVQDGRVNLELLGSALEKCAIIRSSPTWTRGKPFYVSFQIPRWLNWTKGSAVPQIPGGLTVLAAPRVFGMNRELKPTNREDTYQLVGDLPAGTDKVEFLVTLALDDSHWKTKWTGRITVPVKLIEPAPFVPTDDPRITEAVKKEVNVWCAAYAEPSEFASIDAEWHRPLTGPLTETVVCLEVTLLKDNQPVCGLHVPDPDEAAYYSPDLDVPRFPSAEVRKEIGWGRNLGSYSVRVRGVKPPSESRWCRSKYWTGEYTVPLAGIVGKPGAPHRLPSPLTVQPKKAP